MNPNKFFSELKRRNVYKVALAYAITSWLLAQMAGLAADSFDAPDWVMKMIIVLLVIGFPIALILAWAFEMSPQGIIRTTSVEAKENSYSPSKKYPFTSNVFIGFLLISLIGQFVYFKYWDKEEVGTVKIEKSIAVLPFANTKPDQDTDYLGFAIANQIIGELIYLKNVSVRSSGSVRKYDKQTIDPTIVGVDLKVDYVLIGNYLNEDDRIRLTIELVEVKTNNMIWREEIGVDFHNAFELQDIVSKKVVDGLNVQLTQKEKIRIGKDIPNNPLAYEYYLRSVSYPLSNTGDQLAIEMLRRSIELDSNYAPAYYQLGARIQRITQFGLLDSQDVEKAEKYYLKALSINSELLDVFGDLSTLYAEIGRTNEAIVLGRKMLDINPNHANAHFCLSYIYRYAGMIDESYLEMEKTLILDSKNRRFRRLGLTALYFGNIEKSNEIFNIDKGSAYALTGQSRNYFRQGKMKLAIECIDSVIAMKPEVLWVLVTTVLRSVILGDTEKGLQAIKIMEKANPPDGEALYQYSGYYALLGDKKGCIRTLQKAVDDGFFNYPFMLKDSFLDSMRDDPDFQKILIEAKLKHEAFKQKFF